MLEICRASAGSGKTYRLTHKYLEILLSSGHPDKYKSVLAVTFTNKATAEMKRRILEELYRLSSDPSSSGHLKDFLDHPEIRRQAALREMQPVEYVSYMSSRFLILILNDYSLFGVSTIDRFLQQILRAFARELGHFPTYDVELDAGSVLTMAVDELMNSLDENPALLDWLIRLSLEAIRKGEDWNSVPRLKELGMELFSERYKVAVHGTQHEVPDREELGLFAGRLQEKMKEYEAYIIGKCAEARSLLEQYGLEASCFRGGKNSFMNYVFRVGNEVGKEGLPMYTDTFLKMSLSPAEDWCSRTSGHAGRIAEAYASGLQETVAAIADEERRKEYDTCQALLKNLAVTGVLGDILGEIRNYCREKNVVLLSETTGFLSKIIGDSSTPFIYEKVGGRIDSYLLDEFQDTSRLQWENFRPLVEESLARGNDSLVVGDVKQSIYRWRGSDWNLLHREIEQDFSRFEVCRRTLQDNWRSSGNVIAFNNSFFSSSPCRVLPEEMQDLYADVMQTVPEGVKKEEGHVHIRFFECGTPMQEVEDIRLQIVGTVSRLLDSGYAPSDIAFLVRSNAQGEAVADLLISAGYSVMTEESLKVSSSPAVRYLVNVLKMMDDPDSPIVSYMSAHVFPDGNRNGFAPEEKSLYSLCEEIIRTMEEESRQEVPFIQAFLDQVSEFSESEGPDLHRFLQWWDETGSSRSISAPEDGRSVKVLTIHKSKGLEFKAVVIPFLNAPFSSPGKNDYLWCRTGFPDGEEHVLPLACTKTGLQHTIFSEEYDREEVCRKVDALNLAYVAFTRAESELIIFARIKKNRDGSVPGNAVSHLLYHHLADRISPEGVCDLGTWTAAGAVEGKETVLPERTVFVSVPVGDRLKLSLKGGEFFRPDEAVNPEGQRRRGVLLHSILSKVKLESDLDQAVDQAVENGFLPCGDRGQVRDLLSGMISSVRERHWFDGTYRLLNETPVYAPGGEEYRPDRVMIRGNHAVVVDYKFGRLKNRSHESQVKKYVSLLEQMGYAPAEGFLWYGDGTVVRVK